MAQPLPPETSVQERFAPGSICFGCGPSNRGGLRIRSFPGPGEGLVATWTPRPEHQAFPGVLNGGIIGTLLDCHSNWTAALHLMERGGLPAPAVTVTAGFEVRLARPTSAAKPVRLVARVVEDGIGRAVVESSLISAAATTATARATYVVVRPGHPAYDAWATAANSRSASETASGR